MSVDYGRKRALVHSSGCLLSHAHPSRPSANDVEGF